MVRPSLGRRIAVVLLIVVTLLLTAISGWTVRSVTNGSPDDLTPVRDSLASQRTSLDGGSGEAAQQLFPEGYDDDAALGRGVSGRGERPIGLS